MSETAPAGNEYAGDLTVQNGKLLFPPKYVEANQFVCRQRSITQNFVSGAGIDRTTWRDNYEDSEYGVQNPHLDPDEVELKVYGEDEELYRVDVGEGGEGGA